MIDWLKIETECVAKVISGSTYPGEVILLNSIFLDKTIGDVRTAFQTLPVESIFFFNAQYTFPQKDLLKMPFVTVDSNDRLVYS